MFTLEDGSQVKEIPDNYTGWFVDTYGNKLWYQDDKLHRVDGPAIEQANGSKWWYQYGKLHRLDGPAWEGANGNKEWWIKGKLITKQTRLVLIV
jgi:hypothetical protein